MRRAVAGLLCLVLFLPTICLSAGCDDEVWREFRASISDDVATGVKTIVDAIIDGLFDILEPGDSSSSTTTT